MLQGPGQVEVVGRALLDPDPDARAADLSAWARANGVAELAVPRDIRLLPALPVLGTGKLDYVRLQELAAPALAQGPALCDT